MTGRPPRGLLFRTKTAAIHTTFQRIRITRRIHRIIGNISVIRIIIIFRSLYDRACAARNLGLIYLLYLRKETLEASHCRHFHETDHRNLRVRHATDIPFHLRRDRGKLATRLLYVLLQIKIVVVSLPVQRILFHLRMIQHRETAIAGMIRGDTFVSDHVLRQPIGTA